MTVLSKKMMAAAFCCVVLLPGAVYPLDQNGNREHDVFHQTQTGEDGRVCGIPMDENPETGTKTLYFPPGNLYPPYAADPHRVGFGIESVRVSKLDIPNTSRNRLNLRAGGQLALVRSESGGEPDLGWEVSLLGGFNDQNDVGNSLDNIGWDGHYGLLVAVAPQHGLAFKFGLLHVSSHVGDEFMERTGRLRIGYTRQEAAAGASVFFYRHWRLYGEAGRAFSMSNKELQKPWRTQFGFEYETDPLLWKRRIAWYAAADSQRWQERNYHFDISVQTGLVLHSDGRTWRFGVQWYGGRPPVEEFFQNTERYTSFGLWIDI